MFSCWVQSHRDEHIQEQVKDSVDSEVKNRKSSLKSRANLLRNDLRGQFDYKCNRTESIVMFSKAGFQNGPRPITRATRSFLSSSRATFLPPSASVFLLSKQSCRTAFDRIDRTAPFLRQPPGSAPINFESTRSQRFPPLRSLCVHDLETPTVSQPTAL